MLHGIYFSSKFFQRQLSQCAPKLSSHCSIWIDLVGVGLCRNVFTHLQYLFNTSIPRICIIFDIHQNLNDFISNFDYYMYVQ